MHRYLEHRILKLADRAVFFCPLLCHAECALYPELASRITWSSMSYVRHSCDIDEPPRNDPPRIGFFGAYQRRVRNIEPLLEAITSLPDLRFVIRGDSDVTIDPARYPNLDVRPGRLPVSEVEALERSCDILLCLEAWKGLVISGKIFYYASYNKPIVCIADGANRAGVLDYLQTFEGRYITCENTPDAIRAAILRAVESLPSFRLTIPSCMESTAITDTLFRGL